MIICIIGLILILLLMCLYSFCIIVDNKSTYYYEKRREIYNKQFNMGENTLINSELEYCERKCKIWEKIDNINYWETKTISILSSIIILLLLFLLFASGKSSGKKDYKEYLLVKETIEYCVDNNIDLDNSLLVRSIEINDKINKCKEDKQNPWISWFIYNDIAEAKLIDLSVFK